MSPRRGLANLLADLPWSTQFQPGPQDVLVWAEGRQETLVSIAWPPVPAGNYAAAVAQRITADLTSVRPTTVLVVGYMEGGNRRAEALSAALENRAELSDVAVLPVHVQGQTFRLAQTGTRWSEPIAIGAMDLEPIPTGRPMPAADRQDFMERYAPLPQPTFTLPDAAANRWLAGLDPSLRVDAVRRTIDQLASHTAGPTALDRGSLALLLASEPPAVRDAAVLHCHDDPATVDVLVQLYRGAPAPVRDETGVVAATALLLADAPAHVPEAILAHVGRSDTIAHEVRALGRRGAPMTLVVSELRSALPDALTAADHAHAAARAARVTGHSPAPGQSSAPTNSADRHRPPAPPTKDLER
ncbi:MAG: hypothetical protein ACTHXC_10995 [Brachybacterium sp.]